MKANIRQKIVKIPILHKAAWKIVRLGNTLFYMYWKQKNNPEEFWKKLIDKREKEECFIIGNGPSLSIGDLKMLDGRDCFVSNGFYNVQKDISFRPKYYVIQDRYCVDDKTISQIETENLLLGDYFWRTHKVVTNRAYCFKTKRCLNANKLYVGNVWTGITEAYTVTFSMIQIAISLGYKKIYLLGVDHNYPYTYDEKGNIVRNDKVKAHFYDGEKVDAFICNVEGMTKAYISAKQYADKHNIEIVNCTRGGKLELYPRKLLEDVLDVNEC